MPTLRDILSKLAKYLSAKKEEKGKRRK